MTDDELMDLGDSIQDCAIKEAIEGICNDVDFNIGEQVAELLDEGSLSKEDLKKMIEIMDWDTGSWDIEDEDW